MRLLRTVRATRPRQATLPERRWFLKSAGIMGTSLRPCTSSCPSFVCPSCSAISPQPSSELTTPHPQQAHLVAVDVRVAFCSGSFPFSAARHHVGGTRWTSQRLSGEVACQGQVTRIVRSGA
ncbi:hypothetical protein BD311DRAFT_133408 [Dichomitus squalens]|uniref:Uncharacterized protein n=1 Tax=Dichomitus squalens TaxID=114155 RepID=A0A4Q9MTT6_9APHY|nr:hypothetical protein BD311DRAFT_133408 [Dichomitus squalens]